MTNCVGGAIADKLRFVVCSSLGVILDRSLRHAEYPFLDTKFDPASGVDYFDAADPRLEFRSGRVVYAWIQGRGLETLAAHRQAGFGDARKMERLLRRLSDALSRCRARNHGRLHFSMRPDGRFVDIASGGGVVERGTPTPGAANYSDLFCSKGLLYAAFCLNDPVAFEEALSYLAQVTDAILHHRFASDQHFFSPAVGVGGDVSRVIYQGPFMVGLSGILLAASLTDSDEWWDLGKTYIRRVLDYHIDRDGSIGRPLDFYETVDPEGKPHVDPDGRLICDPGHALEFVGLSTRFLLRLAAKQRPVDRSLLAECRGLFPPLLRHLFALGFSPRGGVVKSVDLLTRKVANGEMPWWSLPETMRAAALVEVFCWVDAGDIIQACAAAFFDNYLLPDSGGFARQTLDADGQPAASIPAIPDLDPGYHTNLCFLDILRRGPTFDDFGSAVPAPWTRKRELVAT